MIAEALTVADSVSAADCAPQVGSPTHLWLQIIQAAGGIATTIGVLIALIRDTRETSAEHEHHLRSWKPFGASISNSSRPRRENSCRRASGRHCSATCGG